MCIMFKWTSLRARMFCTHKDEMPQYKFKTKNLVRINKKFRASFDVHNVQMDFTESENLLYPQGRGCHCTSSKQRIWQELLHVYISSCSRLSWQNQVPQLLLQRCATFRKTSALKLPSLSFRQHSATQKCKNNLFLDFMNFLKRRPVLQLFF